MASERTEFPAGGAVLRGVARVAPDGFTVSGHAPTAAHWRAARAAWPGGGSAGSPKPAALAAAGTPSRQVLWGSSAPSGAGPAPVVLQHVGADGATWVGEVVPDFLWAPAQDKPGPFRHCITDVRGQRLLCDAAVSTALDAARAAGGQGRLIQRELSLAADFGEGRWLVATLAGDGAEASDDAELLARWTALGIFATLLLAGGLGWLQLRHTIDPLHNLIEGTQRLAAQEWGARVNLKGQDEFGLLAGSINLMAERIGRQVQAIEVLSAIDREILGGLDTARIMLLVVERLQALLPTSRPRPRCCGAWARRRSRTAGPAS
jgi:HAMP domain-containing protein